MPYTNIFTKQRIIVFSFCIYITWPSAGHVPSVPEMFAKVGKGAGRLDGVSGAAGDTVCRIWQPTLGALALTLSEMGSTEDFEQRRKMTSVKRIPLAVP